MLFLGFHLQRGFEKQLTEENLQHISVFTARLQLVLVKCPIRTQIAPFICSKLRLRARTHECVCECDPVHVHQASHGKRLIKPEEDGIVHQDVHKQQTAVLYLQHYK